MKVKCVVDEVNLLNKSSPVLTHFQNGQILPEGAKDLKCTIERDEKVKTKYNLTAKHNKNVFKGTIGEGYPTDLVNTFIAIRNKTTNKVRLVQVEECSLLNDIYLNKTSAELQKKIENPMKSLLKDFGSKKSVTSFDRKEKMKVNLDIAKEQLATTINDISDPTDIHEDIFDKLKMKGDLTLSSITPPLNKEAKTIDQLYTLNQIISQDMLDGLEKVTIKLLKTGIEEIPIKSKYLLGIINGIQNLKNPDSKENIDKMKCVVYMDTLINLINLGRFTKNIKKVDLSQISEKVSNDVKNNFFSKDLAVTKKTTYTNHKAICYLIILAFLTSSKYTFSMDDLLEDIKLSKTEFVKFLLYVGAKKKSGSNLVQLCMPSKVDPKVAYDKRNKKKK